MSGTAEECAVKLLPTMLLLAVVVLSGVSLTTPSSSSSVKPNPTEIGNSDPSSDTTWASLLQLGQSGPAVRDTRESDPMIWSTFLGGSDREACTGVARAPNDHYYAVGWTWSNDFAGAANYSFHGASDCFLIEFDPVQNESDILSIFGGNDTDVATDVAIDEMGRIYVAGYTFSSDFPTVNSSASHLPDGEADCFVAVFAAEGVMEYSTVIGGDESDWVTSVLVGTEGLVYMSGYSESPDFPIVSMFYHPQNDWSDDIVQLCVDWRNDAIRYSFRTGGTGADHALDSMIDNQGSVWIVGHSDSPDFPVDGHHIGTMGQSDCILVAVSSAGQVIDSYRIGGSGEDRGQAITEGDSGHLYVTGDTSSSDFPVTSGAYDTELSGNSDTFVTQVNVGLAALEYSTLLGGSDNEECCDIALDDMGHTYIAGTTRSQDFPSGDSSNGLSDCYVVKMEESGESVMYSALVGGSSSDIPASLELDSGGNVLVVGVTLSSDFPMVGAIDSTFNGGETDCFIFQLRDTSDSDFDGLPDFEEVMIGTDRYDNDTDGDGLEDGDEYYVFGTDPLAADTDGDGMPDAWEVPNGLNATLDDSDDDLDHDGLSNYEEYLKLTDPREADSDGDGLTDGWEVAHGYDSRNPFVPPWEVIEAHAFVLTLAGASISIACAVLFVCTARHRQNRSQGPNVLAQHSQLALKALLDDDAVTEHTDSD